MEVWMAPIRSRGSIVDKAANALEIEHTLIYDSQVPQLAAVTLNTETPVTLLPRREITEISESISRITLQFTDATRVDFNNTVVTLIGPDDVSIPSHIRR